MGGTNAASLKALGRFNLKTVASIGRNNAKARGLRFSFVFFSLR